MNTFKTEELKKYLKNIYCGGKIPEVVVDSNLSCNALSSNRRLLINHSGEFEIDDSKAEYGIIDLGLVIRSLPKEDEVSLKFTIDRLHIESEHTTFEIKIADPSVIKTHVSDRKMELITKHMQFKVVKELEIEKRLVSEIKRIVKTIKADRVRVTYYPGHVSFVAGQETGHKATFNLDIDNDATFATLLDADYLTTVLTLAPEGSKLRFTGADSLVGVHFGNYQYILNPISD